MKGRISVRGGFEVGRFAVGKFEVGGEAIAKRRGVG